MSIQAFLRLAVLPLAVIALMAPQRPAFAVASPALNVGTASGAPGTAVQVPISIVRNSNAVTATSNLIQYDNTKFTPGTCVPQAPFSNQGTGMPPGNELIAGNGKICSNSMAFPVACSTDSDCGMGNFCNINSVVSLSIADANPDDNLPDTFVADGTFLLCPFTITPGTAPGTYPFLLNTASWADANAVEGTATGTLGSITVLLDSDGDTIPDSIDNCDFYQNPSQTDSGGIGSGNTPDGRGNDCQCGDVNNDGKVTLADGVAIRIAKSFPPGPTPVRPDKCDVNGVGGCTLADGVVIRQMTGFPQNLSGYVPDKCGPAQTPTPTVTPTVTP